MNGPELWIAFVRWLGSAGVLRGCLAHPRPNTVKLVARTPTFASVWKSETKACIDGAMMAFPQVAIKPDKLMINDAVHLQSRTRFNHVERRLQRLVWNSPSTSRPIVRVRWIRRPLFLDIRQSYLQTIGVFALGRGSHASQLSVIREGRHGVQGGIVGSL